MSNARRARPVRTAPAKRRTSPLLGAEVRTVDYTDLPLLRRFISDRGKIRSRRITGITPQQQRMVTRAIKTAREMALLPSTSRQHRSTP